MTRIILGIFFILHGLVHGLYTGQSIRLFELQPGMDWPDRSWLFSRLVNIEAIRWVSGAALALAGLVFLIAGSGLLLRQPWWRVTAITAAGFSSLIYILTWDGSLNKLPDQGIIAVLINLAALLLILFLDRQVFGI